ncbi:hypothetical protein U5B43_02975 [Campylobacter sp. 9BO]|uniref:hypothetical protein n=1 Tax=Campylobacter sp. 9BO TaxID=3424759 RepID=UPI003D33967A
MNMRIFRVLYFICIILTATVLGGIIGIPLFIITLITQYIIFGSINPNFVFVDADKKISIKFVNFCWKMWGLLAVIYLFVSVLFGAKETFYTEWYYLVIIFFSYAVYISIVSKILLGKVELPTAL